MRKRRRTEEQEQAAAEWRGAAKAPFSNAWNGLARRAPTVRAVVTARMASNGSGTAPSLDRIGMGGGFRPRFAHCGRKADV